MLSYLVEELILFLFVFFFQAEDGIRDLVRSRGLGDVYKRQHYGRGIYPGSPRQTIRIWLFWAGSVRQNQPGRSGRSWRRYSCLLYTSDAADERSSVDLGGRRIIKKKKDRTIEYRSHDHNNQSEDRNAPEEGQYL